MICAFLVFIIIFEAHSGRNRRVYCRGELGWVRMSETKDLRLHRFTPPLPPLSRLEKFTIVNASLVKRQWFEHCFICHHLSEIMHFC